MRMSFEQRNDTTVLEAVEKDVFADFLVSKSSTGMTQPDWSKQWNELQDFCWWVAAIDGSRRRAIELAAPYPHTHGLSLICPDASTWIIQYYLISVRGDCWNAQKGAWCSWKPWSSANLSIRAVRVVSLIEIRQANLYQAMRANSISVNSTPPFLNTATRSHSLAGDLQDLRWDRHGPQQLDRLHGASQRAKRAQQVKTACVIWVFDYKFTNCNFSKSLTSTTHNRIVPLWQDRLKQTQCVVYYHC